MKQKHNRPSYHTPRVLFLNIFCVICSHQTIRNKPILLSGSRKYDIKALFSSLSSLALSKAKIVWTLHLSMMEGQTQMGMIFLGKEDCDENNSSINLSSLEICDEIDHNCDEISMKM